jgi:spheroidene monooxygenase
VQVATLSLYRFPRPADRLWVLGQMLLARPRLPRVPGIGVWKLCGSGTGQGFTPRPNTAVWAILATWDGIARAREQTARGAVFADWRARAAEAWTVFLAPFSSRGRWAGAEPFRPVPAAAGHPQAGPLAVLTRASLRPAILHKFWGRVPSIEAAIAADRNVIFKIGLGEVPWLHQITFSIWPDAAAMAAFARADGPHARAIRAVRAGGWFREELYARFAVLGAAGSWEGACPLTTPRIAA